MIGQQSVSILMYVFGFFFFVLALLGIPSMLIQMLIIVGIILTLFGIVWINYLVSFNQLGPLINRIRPDKGMVWVHFTKDKLLTFKIAKRGVYGQTKGMMGTKKADVINKGDFPIQLISGSRGIITYERMSHNINLDHAVAWAELFKKEKISTGRDAYKKARKVADRVK